RLTRYTAFGPFVNRHRFAGYMAMLMPMPMALILRVVRGQARLLYGFAAALMGTAAIVSSSRSGVIGLSGSIVFMMALNKRLRRFDRTNELSWRGGLRRLRSGPVAAVVGAMVGGVTVVVGLWMRGQLGA